MGIMTDLQDRVVALRAEGKTYDEIAAEVGAPRGTVAGVVYRARHGCYAKTPRGAAPTPIQLGLTSPDAIARYWRERGY